MQTRVIHDIVQTYTQANRDKARIASSVCATCTNAVWRITAGRDDGKGKDALSGFCARLNADVCDDSKMSIISACSALCTIEADELDKNCAAHASVGWRDR